MEIEKLKADYINWLAGQTVFKPWSDTVFQVETNWLMLTAASLLSWSKKAGTSTR